MASEPIPSVEEGGILEESKAPSGWVAYRHEDEGEGLQIRRSGSMV